MRILSKLGLIAALSVSLPALSNDGTQGDVPVAANPSPSTAPFPDFGFMLSPSEASGVTVFKLSQDYPETEPQGGLPGFFKTDFKTDWRKYLMQVRDYCFEGNTGKPGVKDDFRVENNKVRKWYHMPWQHYGPNGREGFHGLTKEAPIKVKQLAEGQTFSTGGAWAIGFFNERAGWKIGQVWKDHAKPNAQAMGKGFPNGSVLFKLLFVSIPQDIAEAQVPFLRNGVWWDAYATYNFASNDHSPIRVGLIQMDIMVRDDRAPYGWVLGNFQFNGMSGGKEWENLVPVGLMWGQDPDNNTNPPQPTVPMATGFKTPINSQLKETIINPEAELPPTHLGWNGRLNGPLDNPMSSCFSCHSTAQYPQASSLSPLFDPSLNYTVGDKTWMLWFRNIPCATPFNDLGGQSMDFCLQLAESLQNFDTWKHGQDGDFSGSYPAASSAGGGPSAETKLKSKAATPSKIFPLGRRNQ